MTSAVLDSLGLSVEQVQAYFKRSMPFTDNHVRAYCTRHRMYTTPPELPATTGRPLGRKNTKHET